MLLCDAVCCCQVGIVVGCVLAALAIVALVAFVVARKKYDSVRTSEAGP